MTPPFAPPQLDITSDWRQNDVEFPTQQKPKDFCAQSKEPQDCCGYPAKTARFLRSIKKTARFLRPHDVEFHNKNRPAISKLVWNSPPSKNHRIVAVYQQKPKDFCDYTMWNSTTKTARTQNKGHLS